MTTPLYFNSMKVSELFSESISQETYQSYWTEATEFIVMVYRELGVFDETKRSYTIFHKNENREMKIQSGNNIRPLARILPQNSIVSREIPELPYYYIQLYYDNHPVQRIYVKL
jgi:hypothetical protein